VRPAVLLHGFPDRLAALQVLERRLVEHRVLGEEVWETVEELGIVRVAAVAGLEPLDGLDVFEALDTGLEILGHPPAPFRRERSGVTERSINDPYPIAT